MKKIEEEAMRVMKFEKFDNFEELGSRAKFVNEVPEGVEKNAGPIGASEAKPIGMYEITG